MQNPSRRLPTPNLVPKGINVTKKDELRETLGKAVTDKKTTTTTKTV